jgi:hypothetical protein
VKAGIFTLSAAITSAFFINLCAALFRCGCESLWYGADAHCNVHLVASHRCPWCMYGRVASAVPWAIMVAVQAAIAFWPRPIHPLARLVATLLGFPLAGASLAALYGLSTDTGRLSERGSNTNGSRCEGATGRR